MNTKRLLSIFVVLIIAASLLAACSRSASKAPASKTTATAKGNFPTLAKSQQVSQADLIKTQTAIAKQNLNPILNPGTATPAPQATAVPATEAPAPLPTWTSAAPALPEATLAPTLAPITVGNIPTVTPGLPATYTLQKGEFPYCIARRFNVNPADLMAINGLNNSITFYEGKTLKIPQSGKFPDGRALVAHPAKYTVAAGDTIYSIACKYGDVEPWAIAMANNLAAPFTLTAGTVINIP